jgi:hypothetical protein
MSAFRMVGLLSLVAVLAIGGLTFKLGSPGGSGTVGGQTGSGNSGLSAQVDRALFAAADVSLASYRATSGTFAGAPAPQGMTIARADETSYCIQAVQSGAVEHEVGPGGLPQPGPC